MTIALGLLALIVGAFGVVGQVVSALDFRVAQRLGFQEKDEGTDALYRLLELHTARWDLFVLWTLPVAGILMLLDHPWWPYAALLAGGVNLDAGGREAAKILGARAAGVRVGTPRETRFGLGALTILALLGLALAVYSLAVLL